MEKRMLNRNVGVELRNTCPQAKYYWKELKPEGYRGNRIHFLTNGVNAVQAYFSTGTMYGSIYKAEIYHVLDTVATKKDAYDFMRMYIDKYGTYVGNRFEVI